MEARALAVCNVLPLYVLILLGMVDRYFRRRYRRLLHHLDLPPESAPRNPHRRGTRYSCGVRPRHHLRTGYSVSWLGWLLDGPPLDVRRTQPCIRRSDVPRVVTRILRLQKRRVLL